MAKRPDETRHREPLGGVANALAVREALLRATARQPEDAMATSAQSHASALTLHTTRQVESLGQDERHAGEGSGACARQIPGSSYSRIAIARAPCPGPLLVVQP